MTPEVLNYLARCRKPAFAVAAVLALAERVVFAVLRRSFPRYRRLLQPKDVRAARRALEVYSDAIVRAMSSWQQLPSCRLKLAVGELEVGVEPNWAVEFEDEEVTVSVHRWNWLLRGITDESSPLSREQGLNLMRSWIRQCLGQPSFGRDAYSTGERIVNASLFLLLTGGEIPDDIRGAIRVMARQVADDLEYYESGQTGNHAFNNARALLFAGLAADLPSAVKLSSAICQERLPVLVTADGFLREGSSHYHFLFTRWVLEMMWMAERAGAEDFARVMKGYAARLIEKCWFFLVFDDEQKRWGIPLIGDVSPDCSPEWLIGLPWSSLACSVFRPSELPLEPLNSGWSSLFGSIGGAGTSEAEQTVAFAASGWYRVDHCGWTVLLRAASSNGRLQAGHHHHDLASFVLFRHGQMLLADVGRMDYTRSPRGSYGKSALAHSTICVNSLGPTVDGPTWLSNGYRAVEAAVSIRRDGADIIITLDHDGFARLAGRLVRHRRSIMLNSTGCWIDDDLDGVRAQEVLMRFHFAPGIRLRSETGRRWSLGADGMCFDADRKMQPALEVGVTAEARGGAYFPAYGEWQASATLSLSCIAGGSLSLQHAVIARAS